MEAYFQGTIRQLQQRAQLLVAKIPRDLPREFHLLIQTCRREIDALVSQLNGLARDPAMRCPQLYPERLRHLRRIVRQLDQLENVAIAALIRVDRKQDLWLNRLVEEIRREIAYPLLPPVASSLSREYFCVYPGLGLLCVPLVEVYFLLHLPDLYHELAHLLLTEENDPKVKPFQDALANVIDTIVKHFACSMGNERRRNNSERLQLWMESWLRSWSRYWSIEFFCDLFGVYTVGPAFAWAHLHLVTKRGGNIYQVPRGEISTHPADGARMQILLYGLRLIGFSLESEEIEARWNKLASISNGYPDADYCKCYPQDLLEIVAKRALEGVIGTGCRVASRTSGQRISGILNKSWKVFWDDPIAYSEWEKESVQQLRSELYKEAEIA